MKNFLFHRSFFLLIIFFGILFFSCASAQGTPSEADVYVLKDIIIPPNFGPYQPASSVQILVADKRLSFPSFPIVSVNIEIRNKTGKVVFTGNSNPVSFDPAGNGVANFPFSNLASPPVTLVDGDTYTLKAFIPSGLNSSNISEKVIGNNTGTKTFVSIKPNQALSIPDSPWWMSIFVAFSMVAGLFVVTRTTSQSTRSKKR